VGAGSVAAVAAAVVGAEVSSAVPGAVDASGPVEETEPAVVDGPPAAEAAVLEAGPSAMVAWLAVFVTVGGDAGSAASAPPQPATSSPTVVMSAAMRRTIGRLHDLGTKAR
jgi:hypothetical protein